MFFEYRCLNLSKEGFEDPEQFENIIASSGIDITRSKTKYFEYSYLIIGDQSNPTYIYDMIEILSPLPLQSTRIPVTDSMVMTRINIIILMSLTLY